MLFFVAQSSNAESILSESFAARFRLQKKVFRRIINLGEASVKHLVKKIKSAKVVSLRLT